MRIGRVGLAVITAVVTALVTVAATGVMDALKSKATTLLASTTGPIGSPTVNETALDVAAFSRQPVRRGLWFLGHWDYYVSFKVDVANYGVVPPRRVTLQINTANGLIESINVPPIVKAKLVGGGDLSTWYARDRDDGRRSLAIELDLPPRGSLASIGVSVVSAGSWVPDNDVSAELALPDGLVTAVGRKVEWK